MAFWFLEAISLLFLFFSESNADIITALPGQPTNVSFKQYSGYIVTDQLHGRALFYYFVEAESYPLSRPLTMWLNGGPGCSSLAYGAFMEHGPFRVGKKGNLVKNDYSWNLASNMLYVESPLGVGFSYSNTSSNYMWNDDKTAKDNLRFIVKWLDEFPEYRDSDFFLAGESYAGHYIPQLADLLQKYNSNPNNKPINLKGIALGNPLLDAEISVEAGDYLWTHGAISDETFMLQNMKCNYSKSFSEQSHDLYTEVCNNVFARISAEIGHNVDEKDLLLPQCLSPNLQFGHGTTLGKIHAEFAGRGIGGDPCLEGRVFYYLNKPEVQQALHANTTDVPVDYSFCSRTLIYQQDNSVTNIIPLVGRLIKKGISVVLYSGDQDSAVPLTQTRKIANNLAKDLKLLPFTPYAPWYDNQEVRGWSQTFGGLRGGANNITYLTFATVRGAGHAVPFTSPSQAFTLFQSFLGGSPLPSQP